MAYHTDNGITTDLETGEEYPAAPQPTRTFWGNGTHLRTGTERTLCGVDSFGGMAWLTPDRYETQITCQKCRKAAGLSHFVTKPRTNIRTHIEATVDYGQEGR